MEKGKYHHSEETKRKIASANTGKHYHTPESIEKNRQWHLGRRAWNKGLSKENDARVAKYAKTLTGKPLSPEHRAKCRLGRLGKPCPMKGKFHSEASKLKMQNAHLGVKLDEAHRQAIATGHQTPEHRAYAKTRRLKQRFKTKDTKIELKVQDLLKQLGLNFYTQHYIRDIKHRYHCDILIPIQNGIEQQTIIECNSRYWHNYPLGKPIETIRNKELRSNNYRVITLWDNEIKLMELNDLKNELRLDC